MTATPTYRVGLIGTGRVACQFAFSDLPENHAEAIAASPRCELVAGVNRGREKLETFGERFGVTALFHDCERMLAEVEPDLCVVATHPELHADMVEACAAAPSVRAVICEKPMALTLGECDRMIEACRREETLLQINHNRRWYPEWNLAAKLVRDGAIGALNHIYCYMDGVKPAPWWRSENEGSLLHDFTHYFDLMDLLGGPVEWLCGMAEQRRRPWAVEDFAAAFLKFSSGASGLIASSELTEYTDLALELRGSTGVIRMQAERVHLYQAERTMHEADSGFSWSALVEREVEHPPPASSYVCALEELVRALDGDGFLRSDGIVGRRSLEMVAAVYQSQLDGNCPVRFPLQETASGVEALRQSGQFQARPE